jgi:hypothetical protein
MAGSLSGGSVTGHPRLSKALEVFGSTTITAQTRGHSRSPRTPFGDLDRQKYDMPTTRRRMSSGRGGMQFAGAFLISRLRGSRRRFGRTIALWGLNRFLLFAAPSVLVPPDQSTHRPYIVLPRQRRRNRPDKPKTHAVRLPQSGFVQVAFWEMRPGQPSPATSAGRFWLTASQYQIGSTGFCNRS